VKCARKLEPFEARFLAAESGKLVPQTVYVDPDKERRSGILAWFCRSRGIATMAVVDYGASAAAFPLAHWVLDRNALTGGALL
jgi:hypothetical protein